MSGSTISNPLSQGGTSQDTSPWSTDPLGQWLMQRRQAALAAQPFDPTGLLMGGLQQPLPWQPPGAQNQPNALNAPWSQQGASSPQSGAGGGMQQQPSQQDQQWQQQQAAQQQWIQQQMQAQQQAMQPWQQVYSNVAAAYGIPVNQQWLQAPPGGSPYRQDGTG
jgi:hypothetical protein